VLPQMEAQAAEIFAAAVATQGPDEHGVL
jgi:hypothetical protein